MVGRANDSTPHSRLFRSLDMEERDIAISNTPIPCPPPSHVTARLVLRQSINRLCWRNTGWPPAPLVRAMLRNVVPSRVCLQGPTLWISVRCPHKSLAALPGTLSSSRKPIIVFLANWYLLVVTQFGVTLLVGYCFLEL